MTSFNDIFIQVRKSYPNISIKKARMIAQDRYKRYLRLSENKIVKRSDFHYFMNCASHYERIKFCVIMKNEQFKKKTGKEGYTDQEIEERVSSILLCEFGLTIENAKSQLCWEGTKTYEFRKSKHYEYGENDLEEFNDLRKVKFGRDFKGSYATDEELSKPIDYNHDHGAGEKHRWVVEVLVDILREQRHKVICNPEFAMGRCDVLDLTTNVRYEVQGGNIKEKLKKCPDNTVVIPYLKFSDDRIRECVEEFVIV